ncbi:hypothetical protein UA08_04450 [Talaromyces atroroseus]|uniref:AttH domain-containing protein n=1 Tax=Talaromyces atroroseus TaxID=1441469 RepID=A0A1Q5Q8L0_TALAT|nr:hypothetical protein UA08_04450 [Talaromyces atroroseus]OKL60402.1 hypothetical protein UA08_04450 [Talaromyces atroroseus]
MYYFPVLLTLLSSGLAEQWRQQPLGDLFSGHWESPLGGFGLSLSECKTSHTTAYQQGYGPVEFSLSTTEHLEVPKLSSINATAWEQWEFDGVSESGNAGLIVGFSRDASYAFFGQGNLRVEFFMILEDGTVIQELDYLQESTIIVCDDTVTGIWNSTGRSYSFQISKDMSQAKVWWDTPQAQGSLSLLSQSPPHLADGSLWPAADKNATTELGPGLHFNQPIAGGRIEADVTIREQRILVSGTGGHGRLWAKDGWFQICSGWFIVRASAGPYVLSYWEIVSRINPGVSYYSAQLFKEGELLVATQIGERSDAQDHVLYTQELGGNVTGLLRDRSTGHVVEFVSPVQRKRWRFLVRNKRKKFEMGMGGGSGLTGFTNIVTGGEVWEKPYEGRGFSEQVTLPDKIKQWQIWLVYGIGFLNKGKTSLIKMIGYII